MALWRSTLLNHLSVALRTLTRSQLLIGLLFGLFFCCVAWVSGLLNWRTAAKLAGWWLLMSGAGVVGLSAINHSKKTSWFLWWLTAMFVVDIGVQGVIRHFFGSAPTPSLLVEVLVNTNTKESFEFLREHWRSIAASLVFALAVLITAWFVFLQREYHSRSYSVLTAGVLWLILIGVGFNPTMLRQNPVTRWPLLLKHHSEAQRGIAQMDQRLREVESQKDRWRIQMVDRSPKTVVLVIGESGNRENWGLYGYARDTTAPLSKTLHELSGQNMLFRDAWSSDAFTQPSLTKALTPATRERPDAWLDTPAVTQMAREAGFSTAWLSNQMSQEGWFDALARRTDFRAFVNHGNWRDSSSTDYSLLPVLDIWLRSQKAERELIVVHLMGQHFYYHQRCTKEISPFSDVDDVVRKKLMEQQRLPHIVTARDEYDNATYCGADVLAQIMRMTQTLRADRPVGVVFFSDHGQEVGHHGNFSGHTQKHLSGYSIPMLLWVNDHWVKRYPEIYAERAFRSDWMDHVVQGLLGIRSAWYDARYDILAPDYAPAESAMPVLSHD